GGRTRRRFLLPGRRRHHRPAAARRLPDVPRAAPAARAHVLPRDRAAAPGEAAVGVGAVRLRAVRRRVRRLADHPRPRGAGGVGRLVHRRPALGHRGRPRGAGDAGDGAPVVDRRGHDHRVPGLDARRHHADLVRDLRRPRGVHVRLRVGDRAADAAGAGAAAGARGAGGGARAAARRGLPDEQLHPRRRRGPRPGAHLPAGRRAGGRRGEPGGAVRGAAHRR
ncbi:MAG: Phytoene synthase, partial [uncultured Quadrisphaera sp.]